jgi:hypothetical protein
VIPSVISERLGEIGLDVHRFCIRTLRFFPDVSARVGHPGKATSLSTKRETVQELVVPLRALDAPTREGVVQAVRPSETRVCE